MRTRFCRDQRGSMLVLAAVVLPVLLAFAALALDAGYFFDTKQRMGAAADAAALAGAFEVKRKPSITADSVASYARDDAARNGFTHGVGGVTVTVSRPPVSGPFTGLSNFVEVVISKPTSTFFGQVFGRSSVTVTARAVAGPGEGGGCIYALNTADAKHTPEMEIDVDSINVPNCALVSNGDISVTSTSWVRTKEIDVAASAPVGTIPATVVPAPTYGVAPSSDPFIDMDQASLFGTTWTCDYGVTVKKGKTTITGYEIDAGTVPTNASGKTVFCGESGTPAITIGGSASVPVTFPAGIYIINGGGLDWKHTLVNGTGVVFYLTGDATYTYPACNAKVIDTDGPDVFNISAPTPTTVFPGGINVTPYVGLLFIQDRTKGTGCASSVVAKFVPNFMNIDGVLYFPTHHLIYGATTPTGGNYTILVGGTVAFTGGVLKSNFASLGGVSPVKRTGLGE